ncbi:MAG: PHP domain-containing protein [Bryobacteraceae bacterium]
MHVHTTHSGMCTVPGLRAVCRESYNEPLALREVLTRRGMDLLTVTDHDSIDAAETLRRFPNFFLSEEVTCRTPSGNEFHMGVYDITERQHAELQRRRGDFASLAAYLQEQELLFSINHLFSSLTGPRSLDDYRLFQEIFPLVETRNGQMLETSNRMARRFACRGRQRAIGGSDAHTLGCAGRTYTEVPGARTKAEFLAGLRSGTARVAGDSGDYGKLTRAVLEIGWSMTRERWWTAALLPLALLAPLVTLGNYLGERAFAAYWMRRLSQEPRGWRLSRPAAGEIAIAS